MNSEIRKIKNKILPILKQHGVRRAGLFGSVVRGEMKKKSDIDLLVEIAEEISLLDFIGLKQVIEKTLNRKVDLVEYSTIKPHLREKILKEEVAIL